MWSHGEDEKSLPRRSSTKQTFPGRLFSLALAHGNLPDLRSQSHERTGHATQRDTSKHSAIFDTQRLVRQRPRAKTSDMTIKDVLSSSASSIKELSEVKKHKTIGYPMYRKRSVALSESSFDVRPVKRRRRKLKGVAEVTATTAAQENKNSCTLVSCKAASSTLTKNCRIQRT